MKLDAYGKRLEVNKENNQWIIYELGEGKKTQSKDIYIPESYSQDQVIQFLEDLLHERATPEFPSIKIID
jgi:hypothetical protein